MANLLRNKYVKTRDGLDFTRSIIPYERRHSTNMLAGYITPVFNQFLYPGMSPDYRFGAVLESAPLIATNLDNIYIDIVAVWSPIRLVMTDWNEFLGESHTQAFTINRNITIPKITDVNNEYVGSHQMSRAYWAEHYLAGHLGMRFHGDFDLTQGGININSESIFAKGISVLPSRIYENNWNYVFRNENIQTPILIDKTSNLGTHDANTYQYGLGHLQLANKLKNYFTVATPAPSLLDVTLTLGEMLPVGTIANATGTTTAPISYTFPSGTSFVNGSFKEMQLNGNGSVVGLSSALVANTGLLTVNRMYYALMEQRFANKMMKGRRAVEFYQNFFGIRNSEAGHDAPEIICQKRFPVNITQVVSTAETDITGSNLNPIGTKGAYSVTGFGDKLITNFMATEHGYLQVYAIIRGQSSIASGIDKHLGYDGLLDTYLPEFDHIGPVGIESLEISDYYAGLYFGYTNAWNDIRKPVSDVVGIMEPTEPLAYKTLANQYANVQTVINDSFLRFDPRIIDRIFFYPVCYSPAGVDCDSFGEPYASARYQFLLQFVVKGNLAAVMSADSEPLQMRL